MFDANHYVPILKWKRGERNALEHLDQALKPGMTPLIEIQPVPYNHKIDDFSKTIDQHLDGIGEEVSEAWKVKLPVFVDAYTIYDNEDFEEDLLGTGQHPLEFVVQSIEHEGIPAIPVTALSRDSSYQVAVKSVVSTHSRGVCLRITENDLVDISQLSHDIDVLLSYLQVKETETDIIIDLREIDPKRDSIISTQLLSWLVQFPNILAWRTLTFAATSIPTSLRQINKFSSGSIKRAEWIIYQNIRKANLLRQPSFGDYTITNPGFVNLKPWIMTNIVASLKYTCDLEFWAHRGDTIGNGFSHMTNICIDICNDARYSGSGFSYGDKYIYDCSKGNVSTGNLETWLIVGINHHLTKVLIDLSNLAAPSSTHSPLTSVR